MDAHSSRVVLCLLVLAMVWGCGSRTIGSTLYWVDNNWHSITNFDMGEIIRSSGNIVSLAIDHDNRYIYWSENGGYGRIMRARFDGSGTETLITSPSVDFYGDVGLDVAGGKMYYASHRYNAIYRTDLDGGNEEVIVPAHGQPINGEGLGRFQLDLVNNMIYWADYDELWRASLTGEGAELLLTCPYGVLHDIALHVEDDAMFLTAGPRETVVLGAGMDGSNVETLLNLSMRASSLTVDPELDKLYFTDMPYAGPVNYYSKLRSIDLATGHAEIVRTFGPTSASWLSGLEWDSRASIPEPVTLWLLGTGALWLRCRRRRV